MKAYLLLAQITCYTKETFFRLINLIYDIQFKKYLGAEFHSIICDKKNIKRSLVSINTKRLMLIYPGPKSILHTVILQLELYWKNVRLKFHLTMLI
jgi:hypothetical protein